jgi:hypothetical protein
MKNWSVLLIVALSVMVWAEAQSPVKTEAPATARYQLFANPSARADTFLLDTQTGKLWCHTAISDAVGEPTAWLPEERFDTVQQVQAWIATLPSKEKAAAH